jgi:hypothetical protein
VEIEDFSSNGKNETWQSSLPRLNITSGPAIHLQATTSVVENVCTAYDHLLVRRSECLDSLDAYSACYFSFTNSSTKIAHTPTVMGN